MAHKNTIAIIGATRTLGAIIAKGISTGYRLLLMDSKQDELMALQGRIQQLDSTAEVDVLQCCKDASWEADIIVVTVAVGELSETALKMKDVATCKTVINIIPSGSTGEELRKLLPHSKVINVSIAEGVDQSFTANGTVDALIEGADDESIATTTEIIKTIGFNPLVKSLTTHN
jgi:predicted dinucleotide-binding enzyme